MLCPIVVGRDAEIEVITARLHDTAAGHGGAVFITGEPGIGKSRLLREAVRLAEEHGALSLLGRGVPTARHTPFCPLTEAVNQLLRDRPLPDEPRLHRWLPALGGLTGETSSPAATPATRGEALLQLLRHLAPVHGVVLAVEDAQWADPDTLAVLEYLVGNVAGAPILLVVSARDDAHDVAEVVARARTTATHLELTRLADDDVTRMIHACLPDADSDTLARVAGLADGIPLFVEEVLTDPGIPRSMRDTVRARLDAMSPEHRLVIEAAAILGRQFDWTLLASFTALDGNTVDAALTDAVDAGLLVSDRRSLRFRHALTREAAVDAMLPPRRRALAAAARGTVEQTRTLGWRDLAAELAIESGDPVAAGALLVAAGRESLRAGALESAVAALGRAAELLDGTEHRAVAEVARIEALALAGRVDDAIEAGRVLDGVLDDAPDPSTMRAEVDLHVAQAAVDAARFRVAADLLDSARDLVTGVQADRLLVLDAELALADRQPERALDLCRELVERGTAPPETRCQAWAIIGRAHRLHDLSAAKAAFEMALEAADRADLPIWRLRSLHELGTIDAFDHAGVERLTAARAAAEATGALGTAAVVDLQLSVAAACRWDPPAVTAHAEAAIDIARDLHLHAVLAKAEVILANGHAMHGDENETERHCGASLLANPDDPSLPGFVEGVHGDLRLLAGDLATAFEHYERGAEILDRCCAEPAAFRALHILMAAARDDDTADLLTGADQHGLQVSRLNSGILGYARALLAGRAGRSREADELARAADAQFVGCDHWHDVARLLARDAAAADGWGEPSAWMARAASGFTARNLPALACLCRPRPDAPRPLAAYGVTDREADVLSLLSDGHSNKEIAVRLGVSPRTVEKHVENMLRKTGARSRTQLATMATST